MRSNVAITQGPDSFHYFEAKRLTTNGVGVGISGSALALPPTGSTGFGARADSIVVEGGGTVSASANGSFLSQTVGTTANTFGFAVDYRNKYPIVYVLGPAGGNVDACPGLPATALCVLSRQQLEAQSGTVRVWAYGTADGFVGAGVTLNTGGDLVNRPFTYAATDVYKALRQRQFEADRGLVMQWPLPTGSTPTPAPTLARSNYPQVVIRQGDTTPIRNTMQVTTSVAATQVRWTNAQGTQLATGTTLTLTPTYVNSLLPGVYRITSSVVDTTTGRYAELAWTLKILSSVSNTDDDGDGLTYDQEKALGTDPGNPDTDNDGLSDGAEQALGTNPTVADSDGNGVKDGYQLAGNAALPIRSLMVGSSTTSPGVIASSDGFDVAFASDINPDCDQRTGGFADPVYAANPEICYKRAIRANTGIKRGEFRYFETKRLGPQYNMGHGIITGNAQIDPYCCYVGTAHPTPPHPLTPPSMGINSIGGSPFLQLVSYSVTFSPFADIGTNDTYGFAIDYTGTYPIVYMVLNDGNGNVAVSTGIPVTAFAGADAYPMVYGHPQLDNAPRASVNMGLKKFTYDPATVRAALTAQGVNTTLFTPGVGVHRWK